MTQKKLHLARGFELAPETALQNNGILAKSGAGKSNTSVVMAEEFYAAGVPWIAVDPKGDWWGVRASADGKSAGLEVPVFGGLHGDVPLEETGGAMMAELIAETRLTCILDVSEFSSHQAMLDFLTDFAETLYRKNRDPLHVFAEEADEYLPQKVRKNGQDCLNAWAKLVKRGRFHGLFVTLISQRSAALNNEALSQVDTLMPMRTTAPPDRKAIEGWVINHNFGKELIDSLDTLKDGELWIWSPHKLEMKKRVRFRRRRTFDSGATPGLEGRLVPSKLADINLDAIRERMADTIQAAEEEDPAKLSRALLEARAELDAWRQVGLPVGQRWETTALLEEALRKGTEEPREVEVKVPLPTISEETEKLLTAALEALGKAQDLFHHDVSQLETILLEDFGEDFRRRQDKDVAYPPTSKDIGRDIVGSVGLSNGSTKPLPPVKSADTIGDINATNSDLGRAERKVLAVLAQYRQGRSKVQVALLSGYSAGSGGFKNALGQLRAKGLISAARVEPITATPQGVAAAGDVPPLPSGYELFRYWQAKVGLAERKVLQALYDHGGLSKQDLADACEYSSGSGGFKNALGKLRTLELISAARIEPITIAEELR